MLAIMASYIEKTPLFWNLWGINLRWNGTASGMCHAKIGADESQPRTLLVTAVVDMHLVARNANPCQEILSQTAATIPGDMF